MNAEFILKCLMCVAVYISLGMITSLIVVFNDWLSDCLMDDLIFVVIFYPIVIPIILYFRFKKFLKDLKENLKE